MISLSKAWYPIAHATCGMLLAADRACLSFLHRSRVYASGYPMMTPSLSRHQGSYTIRSLLLQLRGSAAQQDQKWAVSDRVICFRDQLSEFTPNYCVVFGVAIIVAASVHIATILRSSQITLTAMRHTPLPSRLRRPTHRERARARVTRERLPDEHLVALP